MANADQKSTNVLVTGGAGYIGGHTAKALARTGYNPVVLDDLSTGHRSAVKWGPFIEGSLADTGLLRHVFREHKVEAVIHFAASLLVGESMTNPQKYFWNNVVNTLRLLDAMLETGVKHIVFGHDPGAFRDKGTIQTKGGRLFLIDVGMTPEFDYSKGALLLIDRKDGQDVATSLDASGARKEVWRGPAPHGS